MELRIDFTDWKGKKHFALYENFELGNGEKKYKVLSTGHYKGNAGQSCVKELTKRSCKLLDWHNMRVSVHTCHCLFNSVQIKMV